MTLVRGGSEVMVALQSTGAQTNHHSPHNAILCSPPLVGSRGLIRQLNRRKEGVCVCVCDVNIRAV